MGPEKVVNEPISSVWQTLFLSVLHWLFHSINEWFSIIPVLLIKWFSISNEINGIYHKENVWKGKLYIDNSDRNIHNMSLVMKKKKKKKIRIVTMVFVYLCCQDSLISLVI